MAPTYAPVGRQVVSDAVHARLREDILEGRLRPGEALPAERALSEAFGVNRHAVREALKRLQAERLVHVAQGGATRVRPWRAEGGLDLLVALGGLPAAARQHDLQRAAVEMRRCLGVDAARLCARRASAEARRELPGAVPATAPPSRADARRAYAALWERIIAGADNIAYRLAYNSLLAAQAQGGVAVDVHDGEVDDLAAQHALVAAIVAGDEAAAAARAAALLGRGVQAAGEHGAQAA
jgi:GntR family transcriptional regulator, transcriptional repressor for pyruvate dehydrogenase complex